MSNLRGFREQKWPIPCFRIFCLSKFEYPSSNRCFPGFLKDVWTPCLGQERKVAATYSGQSHIDISKQTLVYCWKQCVSNKIWILKIVASQIRWHIENWQKRCWNCHVENHSFGNCDSHRFNFNRATYRKSHAHTPETAPEKIKYHTPWMTSFAENVLRNWAILKRHIKKPLWSPMLWNRKFW